MFIKDSYTPEVIGVNQSLLLLRMHNLVQSLEIIITKINNLKVSLDSRGSDRLGNDRVTTLGTPRDEDLSRRDLVLFGNLGLSSKSENVSSGTIAFTYNYFILQ